MNTAAQVIGLWVVASFIVAALWSIGRGIAKSRHAKKPRGNR